MPFSRKMREKFEHDCQETARLYKEGYPLEEIAKRLKVSHMTIWRRLRHVGIQPKWTYLRKLRVNIPKEEWKIVCLATLIDGEGSIVFPLNKKRNTGVHLVISNTSEEIMNFLKESFGIGYKIARKQGGNIPIKRTPFTWTVSRSLDNWVLLHLILPYLHAKREKAKSALKFLERDLAERNYLGYANELLLKYASINPPK